MTPRATRYALALFASLAVTACSGTPARSTQAVLTPPPRLGRPVDDQMRPPPRPTVREIPLVELRNAASPLVTFRVVFESGSADDPAGHEGLTRLLTRLMTEGGTEELTYEELTRRLFPMAAALSFQIDRDMTVFSGQVHRDHIAAFYPLFRDVLLHPRLGEDDFRRVRTQSLSELTVDLRGNNDEELGKEVLQSLIYARHPYGHPELGTASGLERITLADARAHRAQVFCRDRVIIGLAGGYPEDLAAQVRTDLAALPTGCAPHATLPAVPRPSRVHVTIVDKPSASSTAISIGFPLSITRADADFPATQFVTSYLGLHRQSSGVLYQTLREARGLNYGDYAYAEHFEQWAGARYPATNVQRRQQYASIWLRPVRPNAAHFAIRAALRAVHNALEQGIAADDFDRTRTFLNGFVSLYAQAEAQRVGYLIDDFWNHAPATPYPERMRAAWAGLDRASAIATARRHLTTDDLWIAVVAPNAAQLAEAIGTNAPSPITYDTPKPAEILAEDREIQVFPLAVRPEDVRVIPLAEVFQ